MALEIRHYGKVKEELEIPSLSKIQLDSYSEFLQENTKIEDRKNVGLEAIFREIFPIVSSDGEIRMEYVSYSFGLPRHTTEECKDLKLTFAKSMKLNLRLVTPDEVVEEEVYLSDIPLMLGGGEFIINGAERCIVTQIQRSPGMDFSEVTSVAGKKLQNCRIVPKRGSWITIESDSKERLWLKIDKSAKICAFTFLRAFAEEGSSDRDMLNLFYPLESHPNSLKSKDKLIGKVLAIDVFDEASIELKTPLYRVGNRIGEDNFEMILSLAPKKIEVFNVFDELMYKSFLEDPSSSLRIESEDMTNYHAGIIEIYKKIRPGAPMQFDKAQQLFRERFFDPGRYTFGEIGRFRMNRKFKESLDLSVEDNLVLKKQDIVNAYGHLVELKKNTGLHDDIDHLANRRIRSIKDLVGDEIRKGLFKLKRSVQEKISGRDVERITPKSLINSQTVSAAIEFFFSRGELSQIVDQSNPLSQLTHERRLSALGPGGLNRKRAGFDVRDVHPSHYGRICPIETPEGANIGLIVSLAMYSQLDDNGYGFLVTPYRTVKKGVVSAIDDVVYLMADEEDDAFIAQAGIEIDAKGKIKGPTIVARKRGDFVTVSIDKVSFLDVSPKQMVGIASSLIPFLEHDDANRALMGSNMQRQAVPLIKTEMPIVSTGSEELVARNTSFVVKCKKDGIVEFVDAKKIIVSGVEYPIRKYLGMNERTCLNQKPMVTEGQKVKAGEIIADGPATDQGVLALGKNIRVGFLSWDGGNFEDAILVNEKLLKDDTFTSIHIQSFQVEIRETKQGKEEITADIPNVSEESLANLDETGVVRIGTYVTPGDILVGKVSPKNKTEYTSEERLLHAIFGRAGEDVKNDSLELKPGVYGTVINVKRFSRKFDLSQADQDEIEENVKDVRLDYRNRIKNLIVAKMKELQSIVGDEIVSKESGEVLQLTDTSPEMLALFQEKLDWSLFDVSSKKLKSVQKCSDYFDEDITITQNEMEMKIDNLKRGDELPTGVLEMVKVFVAQKYTLAVGDKMAGRHGNKGVVGRIVPEEDMPYTADGESVEILLNPLGVPSRMNFGQILETHLGLAAKKLNFRAITPVFDGATATEIESALDEAGYDSGVLQLHDGLTGEPFDQETTVGYMYMLKLHHLVRDKIHARSTGPYSLITQQPLGGKARMGGQRFGEMEVWAVEAYGASTILQELLTVKSDDVDGRSRMYESLIKGDERLRAGTPVSFEVLVNEIKGLALNLRMVKR
ncbi:MAG: DNA-directed RNA polymerase subunit beta [Planctomycetota bacterium]|nr:MAG: DNA-directed RNA polymerase subunit beta [Planctomycetota bacterium]